MRMRNLKTLLFGVLLLWAFSLFGQDSTLGRVVGVVKDPSGAVVSGASVSIRRRDSTEILSSITNHEGRYVVSSVVPGVYQVVVKATGFAPALRKQIAVGSKQTVEVEIGLKLATAIVSSDVIGTTSSVLPDSISTSSVRSSDATKLLTDLPGLSSITNGGISSLPAIHGLADERIKIETNGMEISSHCGNHMNPSLSYVDLGRVDAVTVLAGITPVSAGGDSIGGTIIVESALPEFANHSQGVVTHTGLSGFYRSNNVSSGTHGFVSVAGENIAAQYNGSFVKASDYKDGLGNTVRSTLFESTNHNTILAARQGNQLFSLELEYQYIPEQGFVNARMDMTSNEARFINAHYSDTFNWGRLEARVYYEKTRHEMNILADKSPGMDMPMETKGTNAGYSFKTEIQLSALDILRAGSELHHFTLDDWWPPVMDMVGSMGPDTLWNVRNGRRFRFGNYVEWEARRGQKWTTIVGVRDDAVLMNTDNAVGYNMSTTTNNSAAYYADATAFNSVNHRRTDNGIDLTLLSRYEPTAKTSLELGYARKNRAPGLYERYLWIKRSAMSVNMNGWFGDGNGYVGNLDLKSETANTVSTTLGWHDRSRQRWGLTVTPYYTYVQNYIDVNRCPIIVGSNGCSATKFDATTGFVTLQFANHDAQLFGVDTSGVLPLGSNQRLGRLALTGVLSYVRAKNLDTGNSLYNIMPFNGRIALEHRRRGWSNTFELQGVDAKSKIESVRNELKTPGYALVNLRSAYQWKLLDKTEVKLDAGADNLGNRYYFLPAGGRYWVGDKTGKTEAPGEGRTFFVGLSFRI